MSNTSQKKQVFSVSQKYSEVFDILDGVDNKSEFICQAIIEKFKGLGTISEDALESKMRKILKSMISEENLFIVSGNGIPNNIPVSVISAETMPEVERTDKIEDDSDEDNDYLKSILKNM